MQDTSITKRQLKAAMAVIRGEIMLLKSISTININNNPERARSLVASFIGMVLSTSGSEVLYNSSLIDQRF